MHEIISLHIGQAGTQIGSSLWEALIFEHEISASGQSLNPSLFDASPQTFFSEMPSGKYIPRSIFFDMDPETISEIKFGTYKNLFDSDCLISGKEDASNIYARGYYSLGKKHRDHVKEQIRKLVESCDNLDSFFFTFSLGGGTGSGFGSFICKEMGIEYGKKTKLSFSVYPSPNMQNAIVEPYNSVLATSQILQYGDINVVLDNESLYQKAIDKLDIENPSYVHGNQMIAQVISNFTSGMRFKGDLITQVRDVYCNLVPYPRINSIFCGFAPFTSTEQKYIECPTVSALTEEIFHRSSIMASIDDPNQVYVAVCLNYRGDVSPIEVTTAIRNLKSNKNIKFDDWVPTGVKIGISSECSKGINGNQPPRSVSILANTSAMGSYFGNIDNKFDLLYSKKGFVHWYLSEGMEEAEFIEAREELAALEIDYRDCEVMALGYEE